jgi:hypothetical protein
MVDIFVSDWFPVDICESDWLSVGWFLGLASPDVIVSLSVGEATLLPFVSMSA